MTIPRTHQPYHLPEPLTARRGMGPDTWIFDSRGVISESILFSWSGGGMTAAGLRLRLHGPSYDTKSSQTRVNSPRYLLDISLIELNDVRRVAQRCSNSYEADVEITRQCNGISNLCPIRSATADGRIARPGVDGILNSGRRGAIRVRSFGLQHRDSSRSSAPWPPETGHK